LKQLKQVLVFCSKTEESRLCRRIFEALLTKHFQEEERKKFYLDVIYTSDAKANDDDESDMSYEEQQYKLAKFSQAEKSVLFNVKLIGIGVDIPSIDAALIVHPSKSPSSITQKDGRALRTDSRNLDKMASIIVPCWCPFDTEGAEPEHSLAFTMRTVTRVDANDDQIDSVAQPNSTPVRRPQSGEMSTPREIPGEILQWSPPINNSFEEEYFLQVRVLKAMLDDDIEMITSIFDGSRSLDAKKDKKEDKPSTAENLIKSIIGDSKDSRHIPVFDEKLSDFILSVWEHNVEEDLKSELPYRPPRVSNITDIHYNIQT
jgi:superfamily II DNA or RNA helicase